MGKQYNSIDDIPNRRGEYLVMAEFAHNKELVRVIIDYDVDEATDTPIKTAYSYIVESADHSHVYDGCWGFKTIKDMIPNIKPRLKDLI